MSAVEMTATLARAERRRPPKQILRLDLSIQLDNAAHWVLLDDTIRDSAVAGPSGIHTIDRYELAPGCCIAWLKGQAGMLAFLAPAGGLVEIQSLGFSRWGPLPPSPSVAGLVAQSVTVDGRPLQECFEEPLQAWPSGRVSGLSVGSGATLRQRLASPFDDLPEIVVTGRSPIVAAIEL
jgi:hypothetical protein